MTCCVRTAAMPLNAQFVAYGGDNRYNSSSMASLSLAGDQGDASTADHQRSRQHVRRRRSHPLPGIDHDGGRIQRNPICTANAVTISGGNCGNLVSSGSLSTQYAGSYLVCEIGYVPVGLPSVTLGFAGSDDLLPVAPAAQHAVTIRSGWRDSWRCRDGEFR